MQRLVLAAGTLLCGRSGEGSPAPLSTVPHLQAMQDYAGLERFWQRYNKVRLEQLALEQERAALDQDNERLRLLLRQYLTGVSVSEEALSQPNTLLILNHWSSRGSALPAPAPAPRPPPCIIEAAHIASHLL